MHIDKKIQTIIEEVNKVNYTIRKIWFCNAGWGISYVRFGERNQNITVTHTYYDTITKCVNGEYRRIVEKRDEHGGYSLPKPE